jgi:S-adenosylmethionine uptake transporter
MKKINNNVIGIFLGIISTFFYTLMDATIKIASSNNAITHDVLFFQSSSLMLIILFMVGVLKYGIKFFYIKASILIMFIRGVVSFINFYLAFYIVTILHLDIYYSIVFIAPSIAAVLASIFLKEHFNIYKISALFVGLLGVLIITNPFGQSFDVSLVPAIIITVILSIFFALSGLLTRKYLQNENSWTVAFYSIGVCVFFAFIFSNYK